MFFLERRVPPVAIFFISAAFIYFAARKPALAILPELIRNFLGVGLFVGGFILILRAIILFRKHRTTISPTRKANETSLLTDDVFAYSRNPIYLGMFVILLSFCFFTGSLHTLIGPGFFLFFIDRFQIGAEEKALAKRFPEAFEAYKKRTRRWYGRLQGPA